MVKKLFFDSLPTEIPKQVFLAGFEPVVTHFWPPKSSKNARKWDFGGPKQDPKGVDNKFFEK